MEHSIVRLKAAHGRKPAGVFFFLSLLSVMQLGQRFKICMFCFKYYEYLVHGL